MSEWLEALPEELRDAPFIGKAESLEDAVGKIKHAAQYMNDAIRIPGEDAGEDTWNEFHEKLSGKVPNLMLVPDDPEDDAALAQVLAKLGAPGEADKYKLPEIDEWDWDDEYSGILRGMAHEAGMTQRQFNAFASKLATQARDDQARADEATEALQAELKAEWGTAMEERQNLVRGYLDKSGAPSSVTEQFEAGTLPVETMKWLHSVAESFKGEVNPVSKDDKNKDDAITPEEAAIGIQEILDNPAYWDSSHALHNQLKKRMLLLQRAKAGEVA